jgi:dephospho-CoA kinase
MVLIIGITGTLGAGKGTIVEFLKKKGFKHYSVRNFLTKIIEERNMSVDRDSMVKVANELRAKYGPSYIAEQLYEEAKKNGGDCIIESLRAVGEVNALKKKGKFYLFAVDAEPRLRYDRILGRKSSTDQISFEKFLDDEKREMNSNDPNKQNLSKCIKMADFIFENEGTIEELNDKVEGVLNEIRK